MKLGRWKASEPFSCLSFKEGATKLLEARADPTLNVSAALSEECLWLFRRDVALGVY